MAASGLAGLLGRSLFGKKATKPKAPAKPTKPVTGTPKVKTNLSPMADNSALVEPNGKRNSFNINSGQATFNPGGKPKPPIMSA